MVAFHGTRRYWQLIAAAIAPYSGNRSCPDPTRIGLSMKRSNEDYIRARQKFRVISSVSPQDARAITLQRIQSPLVRSSSSKRRGLRLILTFAQYFFLLVALVCLGAVAVNYGRARIVQFYQSGQLDWARTHHPPSSASSRTRGSDHAVSKAAVGNPAVSPSVLPALPLGALVGRLEIPKLDISVMVLEGDSADVLREAVGHLPTSALPGGPGNVVIAGHRDTFFRALRNIQKDDEITVTTTQGIYHYQVESTEKVEPDDMQVLKPSQGPTLTLITCYPFYTIGPAPERFIVRASESPRPAMGGGDQIVHNAPAVDSPPIERVKSSASHKRHHHHKPRHRPHAASTQAAAIKTTDTEVNDAPPPPAEAVLQPDALVAAEAPEIPKPPPPIAKVQQSAPSAQSPPPAHKTLHKVRGWLGSIPRHLAQ